MKENLMIKIARCEEVEKARADDNHPCSNIVKAQPRDNFQIPEPWNGHIDTAEILFISSNPSIDPQANQTKHEEYPFERFNWSDERLIEFYSTRFDKIVRFENPSSYWYDANRIVGWIHGENYKNKNLLKGCAVLTEVVHCKSEHEYGVGKCCCYCTDKWLNEILAEFDSRVKYIIVIGNTARNCFGFRKVEHAKVAFIPRARTATEAVRKKALKDQLHIEIKSL